MSDSNSTSRFRRIQSLVDNKDRHIEHWRRELLDYPPLQPFQLTSRQRRVIASLRWKRELAKLQDPHDAHRRPEEPPPILGYDERNRIVVQQYQKGYPNDIQCWALTREGEPADITGVVRSLKDDRIVYRAPSRD